MKHLFNTTVYNSPEQMAKIRSFCDDGRYADGIEILTGYGPVDVSLRQYCGSVHLPYASDWYGPAIGRLEADPSYDQLRLRYTHYGKDKSQIVETLRLAIEVAAPLEPAYGVLHAGSANVDELFRFTYTDEDTDVIDVLAEIMNSVVSEFPDGEPPFTIAFENTWWPGMRMTDGKGTKRLEEKLEFQDWCVCLDTGHLLFSMKGTDTEEEALEVLHRCADSYSQDVLDRIAAMHVHVNTCRQILKNTSSDEPCDDPLSERLNRANSYIMKIDQHRPFTDPAVKEYVERIDPDYVVHEMGDPVQENHVRDHICQCSLFS